MDSFEKIRGFYNGELARHLENDVLPQVETENGHGAEHILDVLERAFVLIENLQLNLNLPMVAAAAVYHDLGRKINDDLHEKISAQLFLEDEKLKEFFSFAECRVIAEAIEDHRASLEGVPRSEYGKLLSSADRHTKLESPLTITYRYHRKKKPHLTDEEVMKDSFEHLKKKFGKGGYADKIWYDDGAYQNYLNELRCLLSDYNNFCAVYRKMNGLE